MVGSSDGRSSARPWRLAAPTRKGQGGVGSEGERGMGCSGVSASPHWHRKGAHMHGGHILDTRHPLGHFIEHVVGSDVGKVGAIFGPTTGRFGEWALDEVSCTPNALQLCLRGQNHRGSRSVVN